MGRRGRRRAGLAAAGVVLSGLLAAPAVADPLPYESATRVDASTPRAAAVAVSRTLRPSPDSAGAVVLAREDTFPDALGASALTTDVDGPLLLTPPDRLAADTRAEIERVLPDGGTVYLLGGPQALTSAVERALDDLGYRTPRFPGADRIQTAAMIARFVGASASDEVLLVRAAGNPDLQQGWVDSVSCGGWAADTATPVLLTRTESPTVTDESLRTMQQLGVRTVHVCGGPLAVPDAQLAQLRDAGYAVERHAGADRAATAVAVAEELWGATRRDGRTFLLVPGYGTRFGFGLVAAPLSAALDAPILLVDATEPTSCSDPVGGATLCHLATGDRGADGIVTVGSSSIVADGVLVAAAEAADLARDTTPPSVPATLQVVDVPEDDGTELEVSWGASTGETREVTYRVFARRTDADGGLTRSNATITRETTDLGAVLSGLTAGTSYDVAVDAVDVFGNRSALTPRVTEVVDDEVPASPGDQGPTVVARAGGGLDVSWIPALEADVVGYQLQRLEVGSLSGDDCDPTTGLFDPYEWEDVVGSPATGTSYADDAADSGDDYCYRYRPVDSTGNVPAFSAATGPVEAA